MSNVAESFIIKQELKPAILSFIDPAQYRFTRGSSTTDVLIPMFHMAGRHISNWHNYKNCDAGFSQSVLFGRPSCLGC